MGRRDALQADPNAIEVNTIEAKSMTEFSRRRWLKIMGAGAFTGIAGLTAGGGTRAAAAAGRKRVMRVAHITDIHIEPEKGATEGFTKCLHHVQSLPDKPQLILFGGDCIFDSLAQDDARTQLQWDLWHNTLSQECSLPFEPCLGNHDIWGWKKTESHTTGEEPHYGKQRALEALGLARSYRSFDRGGWHFVVLDSIFPWRDGYKGRLDDGQYAWLESDLAAVSEKTPILILSHIPIFSVTPLVDRGSIATGDYFISGVSMHIDYHRFRDLFKKHRNVKVCLSGHTHLIDRVDYAGVTYLCNGAVSGNWWNGPNGEGDCLEGYAVLDLYDDGSFDHAYIPYGWTARA